MSFLLSPSEYDAARADFRVGDVSPELYSWLGKLISVTSSTKAMAPSALPNGKWNDPDAVQETLQEWLEEKLLRGGLLQAFDRCNSPRAFARYMERALRNWLIGRSRRGSGPRLLERSAEILDDPRNGYVITSPNRSKLDRWWGLKSWASPPAFFSGEDRYIVSKAWSLGDFALMRYSTERADPVLSRNDLEAFLFGLFNAVGECLSGRHLDAAFRGRFAYAFDQGTTGLEALPDLPSPTTNEQMEITEAARSVFGRLSRRQLDILLRRPDGSLDALAEAIGVSRGTVDNEYRRAVLAVREASQSDQEFDSVLEKVIELASEGTHGVE